MNFVESSPPLTRALWTLLWALIAAALVLVLVILPAAFAIDLTGFGRVTGLNSFARGKGAGTGSEMVQAPVGADAAGAPPALKVWSVAHPDHFAQHTYELELQGNQALDYKSVMARGDGLLYSWHVKQGSQVYFEFHGEPSEGKWPEGYFESYEKGEASAGAGTMVAPFSGKHGWYWLNLSDQPVTILVELAGYYSDFSPVGVPASQ